MKFTIKDRRFIQRCDEVLEFLNDCDDEKLAKAILRGLTNISKIKENITEFTYLDFKSNHCCNLGCCVNCSQPGYLLIENKQIGAVIVREDNVNHIYETEDILDKYYISKVIRNGDKTILINPDGEKFITTRQKEDEDDIEKAVMILLLKKSGYEINDVYTIINSIK